MLRKWIFDPRLRSSGNVLSTSINFGQWKTEIQICVYRISKGLIAVAPIQYEWVLSFWLSSAESTKKKYVFIAESKSVGKQIWEKVNLGESKFVGVLIS